MTRRAMSAFNTATFILMMTSLVSHTAESLVLDARYIVRQADCSGSLPPRQPDQRGSGKTFPSWASQRELFL